MITGFTGRVPCILTIGGAGGAFHVAPEALGEASPDFRFDRMELDQADPRASQWNCPHLVLILTNGARDAALRFFHRIRTHGTDTRVLAVLPEHADTELFDAAIEIADDFLLEPVRREELRRRILRLIDTASNQVEQAGDQLVREAALRNLVGNDPAFCREVDRIPACARSEFPVLITGETGTGKELFARAIHALSARRALPFIPFDCGAIPDHLLENELFGHARGAFTDAHKEQKGLVALANGGTLFLDEVDVLSVGAQAKLLRLLQEKSYRPLGGERFLHADVKIVAATNRDLENCVERNLFRSDLYYRLNVLRLRLPPLRERPGDIGLLVEYFLRSTPGGAQRSLSAGALRLLAAQPWPGNARELLNAVQRAAIFSPGAQIDAAEFCLPHAGIEEASPKTFHEAKKKSVRDFERSYITNVLNRNNGNITKAAREAGKDRRSFGRLAKKYGATAARPGEILRQTGTN